MKNNFFCFFTTFNKIWYQSICRNKICSKINSFLHKTLKKNRFYRKINFGYFGNPRNNFLWKNPYKEESLNFLIIKLMFLIKSTSLNTNQKKKIEKNVLLNFKVFDQYDSYSFFTLKKILINFKWFYVK